MLAQGQKMTANYRDKIDPRQMSFEDLNLKLNDKFIEESNKRVADAVRNIANQTAQRDETVLLSTLSTEQLGWLARKISMEMEKREKR